MSLGAKLKELRIRHKRSLQDVANAVGASKTHIWDLETGRSQNPSMELLKAIADHFRIGVADLVGENPGAPDEDPELVAMYRNLKELNDRDRKSIQALIEQWKANKENGDS